MYKIVGADQREYGPVTSEQVRDWIAQGRANSQTLASFEGSPWKPLSTYPEFADALTTSVPPAVAPPGPTPYYPGAAGYPGTRSNTAAVAGLVLVIVGTCCSPLMLVGLILSILGLIQIQQRPDQYTTSKAIPIAGIVIAIIDIILIAIAIASGAFDEVIRNFPR